MRMKLNKSSQLLLVGAASLLAASLVTACSQLTQTLTVDFVYVACAKAAGANNYGEINVFEIDSESGRMRQIPTSPFPSQGRNPVAEAVSVDYGSLFVDNEDDNTIVQFGIGTDGKLYPYNTVNTPGIFPLAIAVNKTNLFIVDLYQPLPICSDAEPCSGSIGVFPLTPASGSTPVAIQTPPVTNTAVNGQYWPLTLSGTNASHVIVPTAINVLASGSDVYVTAYDSSVTPNVGYVFGFWVVPAGTSASVPATIPSDATCPAPPAPPTPVPPTNETADPGGTLCPLNNSPFAAGVKPSAIASDATSTYVYVTDSSSGNVRGFAVNSGNLSPLGGSPFPAGNQPSAIVVDPSYPYAYVTNSQDSNVTAYSISNGKLTSIGTYATGLQPVAVGIDPSTEHFLYTLNFLDNTVSGFELSTTNGTLLDSQNSPFPSNTNPTAVAAIPHNGTGGGIQP
jgi:6-phosphogluconolactonase (cycloisomerase 2 family)